MNTKCLISAVFLAMAVVSAYAVDKLQINPQAQAQAVEDAQKFVPDTLRLDFSTAKEIYLDEYRLLNDFEDGMLCVQDVVTGKCGFLNTDGEWAIPLSLSLASFYPERRPVFCNGYLVTELSNASGIVIIDKKGKITKLPSTILQCSAFTPDGYALAVKKIPVNNYRYDQKLVFINPQGQEIMTGVYAGKQYQTEGDAYNMPYVLVSEPRSDQSDDVWGTTYVSAYPMSDGLAPYFDYVARLWGFIDTTGRKVIPAQYKSVHEFSEGLAAVQMPSDSNAPEKWGFINTSGQMVIGPRFSIQPGDFSCGYALVQKVNETFVYIDRGGNVKGPEYHQALYFYHGYALVMDEATWTRHCINTQFNIVNIGDQCRVSDTEYLWRGRIVDGYQHSIEGFDFIGRKTVVDIWNYRGVNGNTGYLGAPYAATTNAPMLDIAHDTFRAYADLTGKVRFVLLRNEF